MQCRASSLYNSGALLNNTHLETVALEVKLRPDAPFSFVGQGGCRGAGQQCVSFGASKPSFAGDKRWFGGHKRWFARSILSSETDFLRYKATSCCADLPSMPRYPNAVRPSAMPRRQGSTESLAQCFKISPVRPFIVCYIYNVYPHFEDQSDLCSSWRCWSNMRGA